MQCGDVPPPTATKQHFSPLPFYRKQPGTQTERECAVLTDAGAHQLRSQIIALTDVTSNTLVVNEESTQHPQEA